MVRVSHQKLKKRSKSIQKWLGHSELPCAQTRVKSSLGTYKRKSYGLVYTLIITLWTVGCFDAFGSMYSQTLHTIKHSAPFQITVLDRFSSVWFSLVTVLLIVCPRSLLLCPFHKKLRS